MKSERGAMYIELLVAAMLVALASAYALATWNLSSRAPANKRATEMGVYVATQQIERLKAQRYEGLPDTATASPLVSYYDRYGAPAAGTVAKGFKAKSWITTLVDRNAKVDSEDLRELKVEVWDSNETKLYETERTLLSFGGV